MLPSQTYFNIINVFKLIRYDNKNTLVYLWKVSKSVFKLIRQISTFYHYLELDNNKK